jgi:predicted acylesterase/phospholipase RssA
MTTAAASLELLLKSDRLTTESKRQLFKHLYTNYGRTALCLSGGASFAYYHFGVCKALLDANLLPEVITGTSGGALVAGLIATRTDDELKALLVPALAGRITACHDDMVTWIKRSYKTGARFDSIDWAKRCSWFTRGSTTFREAYERTGRILNVSCVPSDPHSPTILANYLTSPDCVIWSAVLASAAVPGILNPVVLMQKTRDGKLEPYSFGHKWKDGSLRTDIPLKALNLHFNVNFSIVSQVNPHINLFFFSSRGSVGRPVTHRKGRGWRGGFLGSATEQYLKLDLNKWLKVLRHLELLPRPLGQDWSEIWLQRFSGTITIWPKSVISDFYYILSDPSPSRLARMLHVGQHSAFPKLKFIANRMKVERLIDEGRKQTRSIGVGGGIESILSHEDIKSLLKEKKRPAPLTSAPARPRATTESSADEVSPPVTAIPSLRDRNVETTKLHHGKTASIGKAFANFLPWTSSSRTREKGNGRRNSEQLDGPGTFINTTAADYAYPQSRHLRRNSSNAGSVIQEIGRQSRVFFDDTDDGETGASGTNSEVEDSTGSNGASGESYPSYGDKTDFLMSGGEDDDEGLTFGRRRDGVGAYEEGGSGGGGQT